MTFETRDGEHTVVARVFLGDASPTMVKVELYANGPSGGPALRQEMTRVRSEATSSGSYTFCATVPANRPPSDYTARIIPHRVGLSVPLGAGWILWQK